MRRRGAQIGVSMEIFAVIVLGSYCARIVLVYILEGGYLVVLDVLK